MPLGERGRGIRDARFLLLLFFLALLVRGAYAWRIRDLPTQHALVVDARRYDEWARRIVAERAWMPREVFTQPPLYPYFLAAVYAVSGGSRVAVRLLQELAGAATVVLLAVAALRLFGPLAGRVAGLLAALYGPFVFYAPLLLKNTLTLLAEAAFLVLMIPGGDAERPRRRRLLAAGFCLGLAALLQENLLLLPPFVVLFLLLQTGRGRIGSAVALAAGTALAIAPVTLLNYHTGGELLLTSSQGGMNLYIGNARGASGTFSAFSAGSQHPDQQKADARKLAAGFASRDAGRPVEPDSLSPGRVSSILRREAWRQIRQNPAAWARLLLRKSRLCWNAYEIPDAEGYHVYRRVAGAVSWPWIGFGLVAPLGLTGLVLAWRHDRRTRGRPARGTVLLAFLIAGSWLSLLPFFVLGRYRLPVVPFLIPCAGFAVACLADLVQRRSSRELAAASAGLAVLFLAVCWPAYSEADMRVHDSAIWFNLGSAAIRWAEAEHAAFRRGLPASPASAVEHLQRAAGLAAEAATDLRQAVAGDPGFVVARMELAVALHRRGFYLASGGAFEPALGAYEASRRELQPLLADLTAPAADTGRDLPELAPQGRQLLATLDANTAGALINLGARRIEAGDLDGAAAALRRAIALAPSSPEAYGNLGLCLLRKGERAASREAFTRALALAGAAAPPERTAFYRRGLELAR
jgi:tetratricopeptide (TPR) repeat protein